MPPGLAVWPWTCEPQPSAHDPCSPHPNLCLSCLPKRLPASRRHPHKSSSSAAPNSRLRPGDIVRSRPSAWPCRNQGSSFTEHVYKLSRSDCEVALRHSSATKADRSLSSLSLPKRAGSFTCPKVFNEFCFFFSFFLKNKNHFELEEF